MEHPEIISYRILVKWLVSINFDDKILSDIRYENKENIARYCADAYRKKKGYHADWIKRQIQEYQKAYNTLYKSLNPQDKNKFDSKFQDMKKTIEKEAGGQQHEEAYNIQEAAGHLQALLRR